MLASSVVDFELSKRIERCNLAARRRALLSLSIFTNLGLLATFKYYNFFLENLIQLTCNLAGLPTSTLSPSSCPWALAFTLFKPSATPLMYSGKRYPQQPAWFSIYFVSFSLNWLPDPLKGQTMLPQFSRRRYFDFEKASDGSRQIYKVFQKDRDCR